MIARIRTTILLALGATLAMAALGSAPASAAYGLSAFDVKFLNRDGTPATQAGSHPFAMTTEFEVNKTGTFLDGKPKDLLIEQLTGFIGDGTLPRCSTAAFVAPNLEHPTLSNLNQCPDGTAVGVADLILPGLDTFVGTAPIYNLAPPPGTAARIGFRIRGVPAMIDIAPKENPGYNLVAGSRNISAAVPVYGAGVMLWGVPADPAHDFARGNCAKSNGEEPFDEDFSLEGPPGAETCSTNAQPQPFLTLPRSCESSTETKYVTTSWGEPDNLVAGSVFNDTHTFGEKPSDPADPKPFTGCAKLGFDPTIEAAPTSKAAQSPTGLDFAIDVVDPGLKNPAGLAESEIKKAVVTLPEGFTTNPSLAEGLEICTEAQLEAETAFSSFDANGVGCPNGAKIGTVEVESPLIDQNVNGSLYVAEPFKNEFGSLLALYIVIKNPQLGIVVKNKLEVTPDPKTGQLTTTVEDIPQLPFSHFRLHFREGTRSPLATPQACGTYDVKAVLTPWAGGPPITTTSAFEIISGPDNGPCPKGGIPPFKPGLIAGTVNNRAGSYSPFNLRMFRSDSEQEITNFSIKLPPGIVGKLAGIPFCPDAAIAAAKARTGALGGLEELQSPSCPAASEVGRSLAGGGVGPSLAYAPGKIYLAGPYKGSALSLVAITAARVGPFDLGTVVVQFALKVNPETAEVFVDATGSDPIPHIIQGIPIHLRDIRAYNDRPNFVLNPTNCTRTSTASTLLGAGLDFASALDDNPVTVSTPFQAADCAALPFKPKLRINLKGGTRRGANPALRAVLTAKPGEANIASTVVTLPHSAFLDQSHIRTVCTRVQFRAEACPAGSIYGHARATTPLLDEPLEGPVFLRSSENPLPDLVAHIKNGRITVDLVGRIDSVDGGIRSSFESVPDAPVTKFTLNMQGGKKGLIVNSTNICTNRQRANIEMDGQNGKSYDTRPRLGVKCKKGKGKAKKSSRAMHARADW